MNFIYGYCRVSTAKQNIERQVRNILSVYPTAKIYKEKYTGTKFQGRHQFELLLKKAESGDTIVFDSVSRMSRNATDGVKLYMELYNKGIKLVFLKEPHINTETYRQALQSSVGLVGNDIADIYIKATNEVLKLLAIRQIELAFGQSEKEVTDLQQRTREGIETARRAGKRIGMQAGAKNPHKKKAAAIEFIKKNSTRFGGNLNDGECARAAKICRKTFYNYIKEMSSQQD